MTDKDLKNIYEYMGWSNKFTLETTTLTGDKISFSTPQTIPLDSNSAWEVVQEMERKGDWKEFENKTFAAWGDEVRCGFFIQWLYNPTNFFNCFAKFLEEREWEK